MKSDTNQDAYSLSYTQKLSLGAGSLSALYMLPLTAQAGIIHQATPIGHSVGGNPTSGTTVVDWDVDGDSIVDFTFKAIANLSYVSTSGGYGLSIPSGRLQFNSAAGGQGIVQQAGDSANTIRNLPLNFQVGQTLTTGYQWGPSGLQNRSIGSTMDYSVNFFQPFSGGGGEYFGFSFDKGGQTLYGWAEVNFDTTFNVSMTIEQWAYDDSGAGIRVGQTSAVPAPPALFSMLSGLALGAGGILRGRRLRKAADSLDRTSA